MYFLYDYVHLAAQKHFHIVILMRSHNVMTCDILEFILHINRVECTHLSLFFIGCDETYII